MSSVNYIPQIDYTSKDFSAIRDDLLALIGTFAPTWTSRDPADIGMTMVDLFAYMGDMLAFYIDRAASEGFLATASQRDSVLQLAGLLGYQITTSAPATVTLTLSNSNATTQTIPALTQIATSTTVNGLTTQVIFETDAAVTIPAKSGGVNGSITQTATQGYTISPIESVGISTGAPNQIFALNQYPVINSSIVVYVNGVQYSYVTALIDHGPYEPVFTTLTDANGITYVVFGDGIAGRIPAAAGTITASYRVGLGSAGNVPAGTLTYFLTNAVAGVTVTNAAAASGGADIESTDSIRINAPLALRALNRAVSLKDYAYIALQVTGVAKAVADASVFNNINLYVAPFGDNGYASGTSGATSTTFNTLATQVLSYLTDKAAPNVTVTVLPPTYVPVDMQITINLLPQFRQDATLTQAYAAVRSLTSLSNSFFADHIPVQYVLNALSAIAGIDYAQVNLLRRTANEQVFSVSSWARTSNLTTLTTSVTHNITVGQTINITGVDNTVNGSAVVIQVTTNTVVIANIGTNQTTTAVTGAQVQVLAVEQITCAVNEIPTEGTYTITASGGIS